MKNERVVTFALNEPLIPGIAGIIERDYIKPGKPLDRLAFVFGGRRPSMFLRRELARRVGTAFIPPRFFSIDDFMAYLAPVSAGRKLIPALDADFIIYGLARKLAPEMMKGRESFARFMPWAREIAEFIDRLDSENVKGDALLNIQENAEIGYGVPKSINALLARIRTVREEYHKALEGGGLTSRGLIYAEAAAGAAGAGLKEFDRVYFCNFFYVQKTELEVIKALYKSGKASLVFQGSENEWETLKNTGKALGVSITCPEISAPGPKMNFYAGFDTHFQVEIVRKISSGLKDHSRSVLIVPEPAAIIPALAEIAPVVGDFNVSLGYPVNRSSLYTLLKYIFEAQRTRKGKEYYAKAYINALRHPLSKNTDFSGQGADFTRSAVHKAEEYLCGQDPALGGVVYIDPAELLKKLPELEAPHGLLFKQWETAADIKGFAVILRNFTQTMIKSSPLKGYPLNAKAAAKLLEIADELESSALGGEKIPPEDVFRIAEEHIGGENIPFTGSPLKGFQVLGVLESRSLDFDDVIIMDMNESILPALKPRNALVPREIMAQLGLGLIENEEEITRYYFKRLVTGAKNAHLIWADDNEKPRSRYIEELFWESQKSSGDLSAVAVNVPVFKAPAVPAVTPSAKTPEAVKLIREMVFSPSSVDTYLKCPKQFYFSKILRLEGSDDLTEDPDAAEIGIFVHGLLHKAFARFIGRKPVIDAQFRKEFKSLRDKMFEERCARRMKSGAFMLKKVVDYYLGGFIAFEQSRAAGIDKIVLLEDDDVSGKLALGGADYSFTGRIDRIDRLVDGETLILDYKTGSTDKLPKGLKTLREAMEEPTREKILKAVQSFQLPVYMELIKTKYDNINAGLYDIREAKVKNFFVKSDKITSEEHAERYELCLKALGFILREINDPKVPFMADDSNDRVCDNCPYFYNCR